jgi:hypothetical protein
LTAVQVLSQSSFFVFVSVVALLLTEIYDYQPQQLIKVGWENYEARNMDARMSVSVLMNDQTVSLFSDT